MSRTAGGELVAEYGSGAPEGVGAVYLTGDHLGSTRVVTDGAGSVVMRRDYAPFGEEVPWDRRPEGYGGQDGVKQRFTGKERDGETGLDYFGACFREEAVKTSMTRTEVAREIAAFIENRSGAWDWDEFISLRITDLQLDEVRKLCARLPDIDPLAARGHYCGNRGMAIMARLANDLEAGHLLCPISGYTE